MWSQYNHRMQAWHIQIRRVEHDPMFDSWYGACPTKERPVSLRGSTLRDWTGSFEECTPTPHLCDWTDSFAEHTYKVLFTLNAIVQQQWHYAPYPNLQPALPPQRLLPVHCLHPSCLHPGTLQDPLHSKHPVLSNQIRHFALPHCHTARVDCSLLEHFTVMKANPDGVRTQTGANFQNMANFKAFRWLSLQISFHPDTLQYFLADEATGVYSRSWGTVPLRCGHQRIVRSSGLQPKLKFWPSSQSQALASHTALCNVEHLASIESSSWQTGQPPSMRT